MEELHVNIRNTYVLGVSSLKKSQRHVCVDTLPLELGIGTADGFRSLYEKQALKEACPLVVLVHRGVKEWRVADGNAVRLNEYHEP